QGSPRRESGTLTTSACVRQCARSSNGQRTATAAQSRKASWQCVGGSAPTAKNQRDAPFLPREFCRELEMESVGCLHRVCATTGKTVLCSVIPAETRQSARVWQ